MLVNPNIFRSYDIRGVYPDEIDEDAVYKIGLALAQFLRPLKIVVGQDARISSPSLRNALVKGLIEVGVDVIDIGHSSTPMFYFAVNLLQADGGVEITASHNPAEFNGLKIVREKAIPISGETGLFEIKDLVERFISQYLMSNEKGRVIFKDINQDYVDFLTKDKKVNLPGQVVADVGNGMAGIILKPVFKKFNIDYIPLYFEPDGSFPHHQADPFKEKNLIDLKEKMKQTNAFLGIAFDGDGDRIVFIDENQKTVRGDFITALLAQKILKEKAGGKIMYDLRSLWTPRDAIKSAGGLASVSRVGHSLIKEQMRKEKAIFAGEMSGHFYFPFQFSSGVSYFESSILTMIKVFEIISETQKPISELIKPFQKYFHSGETNFKVQDKEGILKQLAEIYKDGQISYLDGLTVEYPDWWFNIRSSNTESLIRLNLEAKTRNIMEQKLSEIKSKIKKRN